MKKVTEAFTLNAAKRAKVMETISSTRVEKHNLEKIRDEEKHRAEIEKIAQEKLHAEEKHKLEMEREKMKLEKEKYEAEKARLDLEALKKRQQEQ
uniref:Uncharacterized protein n=1 Tax=Panagrolaimus sp. ES5 TaxID=591445 RepID=A0AC34G7B1_9BILA